MSEHFFEMPILNSPYAAPDRHWELDEGGQPTDRIVASRRRSSLVSPIPKPKKVRGKGAQADLYAAANAAGIEQEYNPTETINGIRSAVESWRALPESQWSVTPATGSAPWRGVGTPILGQAKDDQAASAGRLMRGLSLSAPIVSSVM